MAHACASVSEKQVLLPFFDVIPSGYCSMADATFSTGVVKIAVLSRCCIDADVAFSGGVALTAGVTFPAGMPGVIPSRWCCIRGRCCNVQINKLSSRYQATRRPLPKPQKGHYQSHKKVTRALRVGTRIEQLPKRATRNCTTEYQYSYSTQPDKWSAVTLLPQLGYMPTSIRNECIRPCIIMQSVRV